MPHDGLDWWLKQKKVENDHEPALLQWTLCHENRIGAVFEVL